MRILGVVLLSLFLATTAAAEPVEGPMQAQGTLEAGKDSVVPMTLLGGGATSVFIYADEDDAKIACGIFTTTGQAVIVDTNEDDRCAFTITPKATADVLIAVQNTGDKPAHITLIAR